MLIHNANVTGSMYLNGMDMSTITGSVSSETFNQFSSSINAFTESSDSRLDSLEITSGSLIAASESFSTRVTSLESFSSSLDATFATDAQLTSLSSSVAGRLTTDENTITTNSSSFASRLTTDETNISNLQTASGSFSTRVTSLESFSSSLDSTYATDAQLTSLSSSIESRLTNDETNISNLQTASGSFSIRVTNAESSITSLNSNTASYATINGSNTFNGSQTITGSLFVTQNLTVLGSSSISYVSQSTLNIGTNLITVNAQNPSVRFGGLAVIDSGSIPQVSGSWLFDSIQNRWIMIHEQTGGIVTSSIALMGPETYDNLGNETQITLNRLIKGSSGASGEHVGDSQISDDGTTVSIPGKLVVTGSLTAGTVYASSLTGSINGSYLDNGSVSNTKLANSSVTVTAGSGLSGGGSVSLGSSITLTNAGVTSNVAGTGISVSGATGAVTITNTAPDQTVTLTNGSNITITGTYPNFTLTNGITNNNQLTNGAGYITGINSSDVTTALGYTPVTNARTLTINGVSYDLSADRTWSIAAGVTSFNTRTGAITLTSGDVTTALGYTPVTNARTLTINGTAYDLSADRSWTIAAGVSSITAGTGISTSGTSTVTITNSGVTSVAAGSGISVSAGTGGVTITNTITNNNQLTNGAGYITGVTWPNVGSGTRTNYTLRFQPPASDYAGFEFNTSSGGGGGYFLIRGTSDSDVYTAEGITLVADAGWLTLAQRSTSNKGVRIMTGATSSTRASFAADGSINFTGDPIASSSFRAPIFYDSNDTTYYGDFNSTSRQYQAISFGDSSRYSAVNTTINGSGAGDKLILYGGVSNYDARVLVGADYDMIFKSQGQPAGKGMFRFYSGTSAALALEIRANQDSYFGGSVIAPIFYDSNDTGYYLDPNSTSNLYRVTGVNAVTLGSGGQLVLAGSGASRDNSTGARMYESYGFVFDGTDSATWHTQIYRSSLLSGFLASGTNWGSGKVVANSDVRGTLFYDYNDTGYYLDPASTSRLNAVNYDNLYFAGDTTYGFLGRNVYADTVNGRGSDPLELNYYDGGSVIIGSGGGNKALIAGSLTANGLIRVNGNTNLYLDYNYGQSVIGVYSSYRYQGVYSMGDAYKLAIDGTTTGNLYGIAWSHPNAGGAAGNLASHGMLILENGGFQGAWGGGSLRTPSDVRGTIFYDWNNTAYYCDPNGNSRFYGLYNSTQTYSHSYPGILQLGDTSYNYSFSNGSWASSITSGILANCADVWEFNIHDSGHRVASIFYFDGGGTNRILMGRDIGWGTTYVEAASSFRAPIFYDSNNTGYYLDPASTSNTNSMRASEFRGNANVGGTGEATWHPAGAYIGSTMWQYGDMYKNNTNIYDVSIGYSNSSWRAPIFYDNNDTGYYVNPNGASQLSSVYANDWFRPQGCTGIYWQSYSRGIWSPECEGNSYGTVTTYGTGRNSWQGWGIGSRHVFMSTGGDNVGVHDNSRGWIWYWNGSFTTFDYGYTQFAGSARSPIFYDNNDTSYYLDPNSTSRVNRIDASYLFSYDWVYAQGDIIAYYSDERLKTKVGNIENAIDKIKQLNGFYYVNNDLAKSVGYKDEKIQVGLSAQEVQTVLPEVVTLAPFDVEFDENHQPIGSKSGENYLTVNYDKLVPLLIEAIKEQQKQIDELKAKLG